MIAVKKINHANDILSFFYNYDLGINMNNFLEVNKINNIDMKEKFNDYQSNNTIRIKNMQLMLNNMKPGIKKKFLKSVNFYGKGLYFHYRVQQNIEAFLSMFKTIELISGSYFKDYAWSELKKKIEDSFEVILKEFSNEDYNPSDHNSYLNPIIKEWKDLFVVRRKIDHFINKYEIEKDYKNTIKEIVDFRNDTAHGNVSFREENENCEMFIDASRIARESISKYFFKDISENISLELELELF